MRFNPFHWVELDPKKKNYPAPKGKIHVKASNEIALYVTCQGYEVLAGVGTEIKIEVNDECQFSIKAPKDTRAFVYSPTRDNFEPTGEIFTNPDRGIEESGTMALIRGEMRKLEFKRRADLARMSKLHKEQIEALRASRGETVEETTGQETVDEVDTSDNTDENETSSPNDA